MEGKPSKLDSLWDPEIDLMVVTERVGKGLARTDEQDLLEES